MRLVWGLRKRWEEGFTTAGARGRQQLASEEEEGDETNSGGKKDERISLSCRVSGVGIEEGEGESPERHDLYKRARVYRMMDEGNGEGKEDGGMDLIIRMSFSPMFMVSVYMADEKARYPMYRVCRLVCVCDGRTYGYLSG